MPVTAQAVTSSCAMTNPVQPTKLPDANSNAREVSADSKREPAEPGLMSSWAEVKTSFINNHLDPSDSLLTCTDGLTEASPEDDSLYGRVRLCQQVSERPVDLEHLATHCGTFTTLWMVTCRVMICVSRVSVELERSTRIWPNRSSCGPQGEFMTTDECTPRLTIGLPCYDDFDGVWFSVMALRIYHAERMPDVEILVVDNNPDSPSGEAVSHAVEQFGSGVRYCPFTEVRGTAATKNQVFSEASGEAVLCMDSHVLFQPDAIRRLIEFYDENPECMDLLHGPLVYDNLKWVSTHFEDEWRGEMWGVWASDPRGDVKGNAELNTNWTTTQKYRPFEIPAQGMGVFSCRREAWPGFNPAFRGFGGEEFYIHEKFRRAGHRVQLLPFLRWVHRFGRPQGVPYPITVDEKLRNYLIGLAELELPLQPAIEHFSEWLSAARIDEIRAELRRDGLLPR